LNTDDFATRVFVACISLGLAPALDGTLDVTPVDYASAALVRLALDRPASGTVYHLANPSPTPLSDVYGWARARGFALREVSLDVWTAALEETFSERPDSALFPVLPLLASADGGPLAPEEFLADLRLPRIDCANTIAALLGTGVACPRIDEGALGRWLDFLARRGLLPTAAGA
jgi:thioester reductase-like protein